MNLIYQIIILFILYPYKQTKGCIYLYYRYPSFTRKIEKPRKNIQNLTFKYILNMSINIISTFITFLQALFYHYTMNFDLIKSIFNHRNTTISSCNSNRYNLFNVIWCPINPFILMSKLMKEGDLTGVEHLNNQLYGFYLDSINNGVVFSEIQQKAVELFDWQLSYESLKSLSDHFIREELRTKGLDAAKVLMSSINDLNNLNNFKFTIIDNFLTLLTVPTATRDIMEITPPCNSSLPMADQSFLHPDNNVETINTGFWSFVSDHWFAIAICAGVVIAGSYLAYKYFYPTAPSSTASILDNPSETSTLHSPFENYDFFFEGFLFIIILILIVLFSLYFFNSNKKISKIRLKINFYLKKHKILHIFFYLSICFLFFSFTFLYPFFCPFVSYNLFHKFLLNTISFLMFVLIIYILLYRSRNLSLSFFSFICFSTNVFFILVSLSIIINVIHGLPKEPIFVEQLSLWSGVRYGIFILCCFFGLLLFLISKILNISAVTALLEKISFPYVLYETQKILKTWESAFFGELFEKILNIIAYNKFKSYFIFLLHFFFSFFVPCLQVIFFINFTFFSGDLRYNLYLMPLSLLSWLFKILYFYFSSFVEENSNNIRDALNVNYKDPNIVNEKNDIIKIQLSLLDISFKDPNMKDPLLLDEYKKYFILLGISYSKLSSYKNYTFFFSYILFFFRFSCWIGICFKLFFFDSFGFTQSFIFRVIPSVIRRGYAQEAFLAKKAYQKTLEKITKGAYSSGHPITTDVDKIKPDGSVSFDHQPTHGKGAPNNPSRILSPDKDLQGNPRPQFAVYPENNNTEDGPNFPRKWLKTKAIPGSKEFYEDPVVKENDKKNKYLKNPSHLNIDSSENN